MLFECFLTQILHIDRGVLVIDNSNENIFELTKFMGGGMTVSCFRENPHQLVFDDDLFDLGPNTKSELISPWVASGLLKR